MGLKIPLRQRFETKVKPDKKSGCHLWIGAFFPRGYGKIYVRGKLKLAHRISWKLYRGPIPKGKHVLHSCDNPPCVNPDHLFLGTQVDNNADMYAKGRNYDKHGIANPRAKFTLKQIYKIRQDNRYQYVIAKFYGVSQSTISRIQRREVYA